MKIERLKDFALKTLIDDGGHRMAYDKFIFLLNQSCSESDSKLIQNIIVSMEVDNYIKIEAKENNIAKIYLTAEGIQLYVNGGFYQRVMQRKLAIGLCIFFLVFCMIGIVSINFLLLVLSYSLN